MFSDNEELFPLSTPPPPYPNTHTLLGVREKEEVVETRASAEEGQKQWIDPLNATSKVTVISMFFQNTSNIS